MKLRLGLVGAGAIGACLAIALKHEAASDAASHTWSPFVLVTSLLLIGVVANEDGVFSAAASFISRIPGGDLVLYLSPMLLVAIVTVFLNLDTSVVFLTPVLVHVARRRGADELRFLYGCVFMSNAASLLLPGSNLTNLLILAQEHVSGSVFLARMAAPWAAAVVVTAAVVALAFRGQSKHSPITAAPEPHSIGLLSGVGILVAVVLILALADSAIPVLGVGLTLTAIRLAQGRLDVRHVSRNVDVLSLLGVFLVAVSLGTVARVWTYPGHLMATAGNVASAAIGAVTSVFVNNRPAAVLLGSRMPAHPRSLLLGLNIGPNLAVTGSLSALLWWQAARSVDARPSALRYSAVGIFLVPVTLAATLAAAHVVP